MGMAVGESRRQWPERLVQTCIREKSVDSSRPHDQHECCAWFHSKSLFNWLQKLDWIADGIFYPDLSADGTHLDLTAKRHSRVLRGVDLRRQVRHAQDHSIPPARLLGFAGFRLAMYRLRLRS
jgi:hypothetical protein